MLSISRCFGIILASLRTISGSCFMFDWAAWQTEWSSREAAYGLCNSTALVELASKPPESSGTQVRSRPSTQKPNPKPPSYLFNEKPGSRTRQTLRLNKEH